MRIKLNQAWGDGCPGSTSSCCDLLCKSTDATDHPDSSAYQDDHDDVRVVRCHGFDGRATNVVLYLPQLTDQDTRGNVVLFPGDVQDLHHRM